MGCKSGMGDHVRPFEVQDYGPLLDREVQKGNPLNWVLGSRLISDLAEGELLKLAEQYANGRDMPPPARIPGVVLLLLKKMQRQQQEALEQLPRLLTQFLRSEVAFKFRAEFFAFDEDAIEARTQPIIEDVIKKYWGGREPETLSSSSQLAATRW